jgi:hypothetical protein
MVAAGCSVDGYTGSGSASDPLSYDRSKAVCEGRGLVWVGRERGCLSPAEIERWKTSGCGHQGFYKCAAKDFPEWWEMPRGKANAAGSSPRWTCSYLPTMDQDWHNDVLCTNGVAEERPYLRQWDSFVTEAEIMQSARKYERQLNPR